MTIGVREGSLHVLFGKAFLIELQRGDLETAKLFARAFLMRTTTGVRPTFAGLPTAT